MSSQSCKKKKKQSVGENKGRNLRIPDLPPPNLVSITNKNEPVNQVSRRKIHNDGDTKNSGEEYSDDFEDDYSDECDDDYSDEFEEDSVQDNAENNETHLYRDQDIGQGLVLKVPEGAPNVQCHVEPLSAEDRTEMLEELQQPDDDIMVSDIYRVMNGEFANQESRPPYKLQLPLDLPNTKLDKRDLFGFIVHKKNEEWNKDKAEYEDSLVRFKVDILQYFVVFASPYAEIAEVTSRGYTFVSSKDHRIRVDIPSGAVTSNMTISIEIRPANKGRLEWYRAYDPDAFEGIYAFSDILSVRHACDQSFQKKTRVNLPIASNVSEKYEVKALNIDKGEIEIGGDVKQAENGTVDVVHTVTGTNSCQASLVRPGLNPDCLRKCALFQAKELNMCKILTYVSKSPRLNCRTLTVEVVEAPYAREKVKSRHKKGYYEIMQSRSPDMEIHRRDRIRIITTGNIQFAGNVTKRSFQFLPTSSENYVDLTVKPLGFMTGVSYGVVAIQIGENKEELKVHEIHFYVDHIPMQKTPNLNKKTISLDNRGLQSNSKDGNGRETEFVTTPITDVASLGQQDTKSTLFKHDQKYMTELTKKSNKDGGEMPPASARPKTATKTSSLIKQKGRQSVEPIPKRKASASLSHGLSLPSPRDFTVKSKTKLSEISRESTSSDVTEGTSGYYTEDIISPKPPETYAKKHSEGEARTLKCKAYKNSQQPLKSVHEDNFTGESDFPPRGATTKMKKKCGKTESVLEASSGKVSNIKGKRDTKRYRRESGEIPPLNKTFTKDVIDVPCRLNEASMENLRESSRLKAKPEDCTTLDEGHPVLSQRSLQVLSQQLTPTEWQQLMVELEMGADNITMIIQKASKENWNPYFKLLLTWYNERVGEYTDEHLITILEESFKQISRADIAQKIAVARKRNKPLRKDNFK